MLDLARVCWPTIERLLGGQHRGVLTVNDVGAVMDGVVNGIFGLSVAEVRRSMGIVLLVHVEYLAQRRGGRRALGEAQGVEALLSRVRPADAFEDWCAGTETAGKESLESLPFVVTVRELLGGRTEVSGDDLDVQSFLVGRKLLHENGSSTVQAEHLLQDDTNWGMRDLLARWFRDRLECEQVTLEAAVAGLLAAVGGAEVRIGDLQCLARAQRAVDEFGRRCPSWELDDEVGWVFDGWWAAGVVRDGPDITVPPGLGSAVALFTRRLADEGLVRREVVAGWRTLLLDPEVLLAVSGVLREKVVAPKGVAVSARIPC